MSDKKEKKEEEKKEEEKREKREKKEKKEDENKEEEKEEKKEKKEEEEKREEEKREKKEKREKREKKEKDSSPSSSSSKKSSIFNWHGNRKDQSSSSTKKENSPSYHRRSTSAGESAPKIEPSKIERAPSILIHTSRSEKEIYFHKKFELEKEETLLFTTICAFFVKGFIHQGRIFISKKHVCFSSKVLATDLILEVDEISLLKKKKTVRVINNAIEITMKEGTKYFFTSFLNRDKAFDYMDSAVRHLTIVPDVADDSVTDSSSSLHHSVEMEEMEFEDETKAVSDPVHLLSSENLLDDLEGIEFDPSLLTGMELEHDWTDDEGDLTEALYDEKILREPSSSSSPEISSKTSEDDSSFTSSEREGKKEKEEEGEQEEKTKKRIKKSNLRALSPDVFETSSNDLLAPPLKKNRSATSPTPPIQKPKEISLPISPTEPKNVSILPSPIWSARVTSPSGGGGGGGGGGGANNEKMSSKNFSGMRRSSASPALLSVSLVPVSPSRSFSPTTISAPSTSPNKSTPPRATISTPGAIVTTTSSSTTASSSTSSKVKKIPSQPNSIEGGETEREKKSKSIFRLPRIPVRKTKSSQANNAGGNSERRKIQSLPSKFRPSFANLVYEVEELDFPSDFESFHWPDIGELFEFGSQIVEIPIGVAFNNFFGNSAWFGQMNKGAVEDFRWSLWEKCPENCCLTHSLLIRLDEKSFLVLVTQWVTKLGGNYVVQTILQQISENELKGEGTESPESSKSENEGIRIILTDMGEETKITIYASTKTKDQKTILSDFISKWLSIVSETSPELRNSSLGSQTENTTPPPSLYLRSPTFQSPSLTVIPPQISSTPTFPASSPNSPPSSSLSPRASFDVNTTKHQTKKHHKKSHHHKKDLRSHRSSPITPNLTMPSSQYNSPQTSRSPPPRAFSPSPSPEIPLYASFPTDETSSFPSAKKKKKKKQREEPLSPLPPSVVRDGAVSPTILPSLTSPSPSPSLSSSPSPSPRIQPIEKPKETTSSSVVPLQKTKDQMEAERLTDMLIFALWLFFAVCIPCVFALYYQIMTLETEVTQLSEETDHILLKLQNLVVQIETTNTEFLSPLLE